jgi:hypothetical protein
MQNLKKSYFRICIRNPRFYVLFIFAAFKNKITKDMYVVKDKFNFFSFLSWTVLLYNCPIKIYSYNRYLCVI